LNSRQNSNRAPSHARPASDEEIEAEENLAKEAALILARVQKNQRGREVAPRTRTGMKKKKCPHSRKVLSGRYWLMPIMSVNAFSFRPVTVLR
jgi:hypothetical protein